jgi:outer membrane protein OmpA-like peptidoglycan-associated protein
MSAGRRVEPPQYWVSFAELMANLLLVILLALAAAVWQQQETERAGNHRQSLLEKQAAAREQEATRAGAERDTERERNQQLEEKLRLLFAELARLEQLVNALEEKLARASAELSAERARRISAEAEADGWRHRHDSQAAVASRLTSRAAVLEGTVAAGNTKLTSISAELDRYRGKLSDTSTQLATATQAANVLTGERNQLADRVARLLSELREVRGVRPEMLAALRQAFPDGYARIDPRTGALVLEASVLFDVDEAALRPGADAVLDQFLLYLSTFLRENQALREQLAHIQIEGHCDPTGGFDHNLELSLVRAANVARYLLAQSPDREFLEQVLSVTGRSKSDPIYTDASRTTIDLDRSRRIEVKFVLASESLEDPAAETPKLRSRTGSRRPASPPRRSRRPRASAGP